MVSRWIAAAALAPTLFAAAVIPAHASDDHCRHVPQAEWRPMEEAVAAVRAKGYEIREIERDDGCYEVKASGKSGERIKLYLDPATLEVVRSRSGS